MQLNVTSPTGYSANCKCRTPTTAEKINKWQPKSRPCHETTNASTFTAHPLFALATNLPFNWSSTPEDWNLAEFLQGFQVKVPLSLIQNFLTEIGHLPDFYPGMCTVDRADTWLPTQLPALLQRSSFPPPQWFMLWTMCHCPIITTQGVPSGGASTKQSPSNHLKLDTFMDSRDSSRLQEPWMDQRPSIPPQDGLCHYYFPAQREKTSQVAAGESWMTKLKMT